MDDALSRARDLFQRAAWVECLSVLSQAESREPLSPEGVELMARCAYLVGREEDCVDVCARAYTRFEAEGEHRMAARAAFWIAFILLNRGELSRGGGWAARSRALVDAHALGGSEEGLMLALEAHLRLLRGQPMEAASAAEVAVGVGLDVPDADVVALARLTLAWAHLRQGRNPEAMTVFDEVMVAVSAEETSPIVAGLAYCGVVSACMQLRDLRRATEWTAALASWCQARPDLVPYRGTCLVHRSQILTLQGSWPAALEEAARACALLPGGQGGDALYQLGELNRLMGNHALAEADFRRANAAGRQPEPGLARLRIAQGRPELAVATLRRLCAEGAAPEDRAEFLAALADAQLAAGDVAAARTAAEQVGQIAAGLDAPLVSALAAQALGSVQLAEGEPAAALALLRKGWQVWRELELPYPAACVRVLVARCLRGLGDEDSARMELDAARDVFVRLGARPDLEALDRLLPGGGGSPGGLTDREVQVLRLVASGRSNRAVAAELFLSEKTVARHLSNIYTKLDVASRAAATAYAYDHHLV